MAPAVGFEGPVRGQERAPEQRPAASRSPDPLSGEYLTPAERREEQASHGLTDAQSFTQKVTTGETLTESTPAQKSSPAPKPGRSPAELSKIASQLYEAMHGGMWGAGTDEEAIFKALNGISPAEIAEVRRSYEDHYKRNLDADLKSELSGADLQRAEALMNATQADADAIALYDAMKGAGTNEKAIFSVLEGKTPPEVAAIKQAFKNKYGAELDGWLRDELGGASLDRALALTSPTTSSGGHNLEADVHRLQEAMAGAGTDEATIMDVLANRSPEELQGIKHRYRQRYGHSLENALKSELSGTEKDRAFAMLGSDQASAEAARLRAAIAGVGTDEKAILSIFEGKSDEERKSIVAAYERNYGRKLQDDLRGDLSDREFELVQSAIDTGKLSDAQKLLFAMEGAGTNEEEIKAILEGKTRGEIAQIRDEYRKRYGEELGKRLDSELSGRDHFETKMAMRGRAETIEEEVSRIEERREYERSGVSGWVMDRITDKGKLLDESVQRLQETLEKAKQNKEMSQEDRKRLRELADYSHQDTGTYINAKNSVADTAATVAATAGATVVVVASGGTATPLVFTLAAAASAAGYVGAKAIVQGRAYDLQGAVVDGTLGAVEGVVTAASAGIGKAVTKIGQRLAESAAGKMLRGTYGSILRRGAAAGAEGAINGGLGGAAGGAAREGLNDETWQHGFMDGLGRVGNAAIANGLAGAIGGGVMSAGMAGIGAAVSAGVKRIKLREAASEGLAVRSSHPGATAADGTVASRSPTAQTHLDSARVAKEVNRNLRHFSPAEIEAALQKLPQAERDEAARALYMMTEYTNPAGLERLRKVLPKPDEFVHGNARIYAPGTDSVADVLHYFTRPKGIINGEIGITRTITKDTIVILDEVMMDRLSRSPELAAEIVAKKAKILLPEGISSGTKLGGAPGSDEILARAAAITKAAKQLRRTSGEAMSFEDAVGRVLQEQDLSPLRRLDEKLGLQGKLVERVEPVRAKRLPPADSAVEHLSSRLNSNQGASPADIEMILKRFPPEQQPMALKLIAGNTEAVSPRRLGELSKELFQEMQRQGLEPEKAVYVVPRQRKSYGFVTRTFRESNGISPGQVVNLEELKALAASQALKGKRIVLLDDLSASGNQMVDWCKKLRTAGADGEIVAASILATDAFFHRVASLEAQGLDDIWALTARRIPTLRQSALFRAASPETRTIIEEIVGKCGFGGTNPFDGPGLMVAFPHMSPNSNNEFFYSYLVRLLTENGGGAKPPLGVKPQAKMHTGA